MIAQTSLYCLLFSVEQVSAVTYLFPAIGNPFLCLIAVILLFGAFCNSLSGSGRRMLSAAPALRSFW